MTDHMTYLVAVLCEDLGKDDLVLRVHHDLLEFRGACPGANGDFPLVATGVSISNNRLCVEHTSGVSPPGGEKCTPVLCVFLWQPINLHSLGHSVCWRGFHVIING